MDPGRKPTTSFLLKHYIPNCILILILTATEKGISHTASKKLPFAADGDLEKTTTGQNTDNIW